MADAVEKWNREVCIGAAVTYVHDDNRVTLTKTRTAAELLSGHTAVVWLEDVRGCVALERVKEWAAPAQHIHKTIADSHTSLQRGRVWCLRCGQSRQVDSAECLRSGWPLCCGETMSIDSPEETKARRKT